MKLCGNKKCAQIDPEFGKDSRAPDKLYYMCKKCASDRVKQYYIKNPGKKQLVNLLYNRFHKEQIKIRDHNYAKKNRSKIRARNRIWYKQRIEKDINFRLSRNLRSRIRTALLGNAKRGSAIRDLGCTIEEFKRYIEKKFLLGMTWINYGEWELDHIFPLSKVDLTDRQQFLQVCHYTNYQPLWKTDNLSKFNKIV